METVELNTARKLVAMIKDSANPQVQHEAILKRDQWLIEADAGTLYMTAEVREALESA